MENEGFVSIVIPAFNAEEFIQNAVRSCVCQTYRPLEIVVVNDGSTDSTVERTRAMSNFAKSNEVLLKLTEIDNNRGAANALKVGFSISRGSYVCWLSADDMFIDKKKIEKQVAQMKEKKAMWSYYRDAYQGKTLSTSRLQRSSYLPHLSFLDPLFINDSYLRMMLLLFRNPINGSSIMIIRDCFEKYGQFDPLARNVDLDGDLWMRYSCLKLKLVAMKGAPVFYREHSNQTSRKKGLMLYGSELTRMRMLTLLAKKGILLYMLKKFSPYLPIVLSTKQPLARPLVSEFLFNYILYHKEEFNRILVKCIRKSLVDVRNHPNYSMLDRNQFLQDLESFAASPEFKRFEENISKR
jgi:glycosyltransferase involved in cell wall biosynthesis